FLPGDDLEDRILPVPMAHDLGALIGRMDVALAGLSSVGHAHAHVPPPHDLTHFAETRRRLSQCCRHARDGRQPMNIGAAIPWPLVDRCLDDLEARARSWGSLPRQLIHGDLSAQNLLADGARVTGVLDFGDVAVGARVADIAVAICHLGFAQGRAHTRIIRALWDGWSNVVSPTATECRVLPALMTSRFCKLIVDHAWRELHAPPRPGHGALINAGVQGLHALMETPRQEVAAL
ncbi:MAG: phosphotransferase, partial [Deltaproteobacteria bacterium]|nr:phosphotransferase [Deltaproteobacteria bacterium]